MILKVGQFYVTLWKYERRPWWRPWWRYWR